MTLEVPPEPKRRVVVSHAHYRCDTGCCGHVVYVDATVEDGWATGTEVGDFDFMHGGEDDPVAYARAVCEKALGKEHCADLDWDNCVLVGDCDW